MPNFEHCKKIEPTTHLYNLQDIHYANNLMIIQLYNSTEKKSSLVNFWTCNLIFEIDGVLILCRVVELEIHQVIRIVNIL